MSSPNDGGPCPVMHSAYLIAHIVADHPIVDPMSWCGEWSPKKGSDPC